jgi:hypothetical protein
MRAMSISLGLVAFDDVVLRTWARYGLHEAGFATWVVADRATLFEALAHGPPVLVIGATFDRAPAWALLAQIRAAGSRVGAIVVGAGGVLDSHALARAAQRCSASAYENRV